MIKKSPIALAAFVLAMGTATLSLIPPVAQAQSAEEQKKKEVIRQEWSKPWNEIQKAIAEKNFPDALAKINALASAENQTAYEKFFLSRTRAVIASSTADNALLVKCFEEMIDSEFLSKEEKIRYAEAMSGTLYNDKKYKESQVWVKRYFQLGGNAPVMQDLEVQNYYFSDDFANAAATVKAQIAVDEQANRVPGQTRLRLLHGASMKLKDIDGSTFALERLVKYHPQKDYWADLLFRLPSKPGFNDRLRSDWYRLVFATENLEDANMYVEMAEIALLAGLPIEAKQVVDAGYQAGILGKGPNAAKHKSLQDKANKQAADDAKTLDAGEASAKAAKTGLAMVNMGFNLVLNGQAPRGIALIEQGIAKGGLKFVDEAKLRLGQAYLKAGNRDKATEVLQSIQTNDGSSDLARYFLMFK